MQYMKRLLLSAMALGMCAISPVLAQQNKLTDEENQTQFWIGKLPEGECMVQLSRLGGVFMHRYVLDNACMVYEVTLIISGNTPTKFYYIEMLGKSSGINAVRNVTNRISELGGDASRRLTGSEINPDTTVAKVYPNTNCVEYRIATLDQLNKLYASIVKAWKNGRGRTFKP